ncbi:unnamed protein product [Blepharisma stoltei]|uniref:Protein yippee-like n=1 Tax=Blepharisma stoltei TaxID=1481888 RepID=A0AAU9JD65_9CILI|nr:unnamed protein product [Blepharisma stoltei]
MGKRYLEYIDSSKYIYKCKFCKCHLSSKDHLISKNFTSGSCRAYLFTNAFNVYYGESKRKELLTGLHDISYVYCENCERKMGWKYIWAAKPEEKYKEGNIILERNSLYKF